MPHSRPAGLPKPGRLFSQQKLILSGATTGKPVSACDGSIEFLGKRHASPCRHNQSFVDEFASVIPNEFAHIARNSIRL